MALMESGFDALGVTQEGIELCRQGSWRQGLDLLRKVAEADDRSAELPGLFYSFLGFGIARFDRRVREGIALCQHAVKREFYQPENYVNLARTYLLAEDRRRASETVLEGLKIDPDHRGLADLLEELGIRRRPVLPFLSRRNPLNYLLGKVRHALSPPRETEPGAADEPDDGLGI